LLVKDSRFPLGYYLLHFKSEEPVTPLKNQMYGIDITLISSEHACD